MRAASVNTEAYTVLENTDTLTTGDPRIGVCMSSGDLKRIKMLIEAVLQVARSFASSFTIETKRGTLEMIYPSYLYKGDSFGEVSAAIIAGGTRKAVVLYMLEKVIEFMDLTTQPNKARLLDVALTYLKKSGEGCEDDIKSSVDFAHSIMRQEEERIQSLWDLLKGFCLPQKEARGELVRYKRERAKKPDYYGVLFFQLGTNKAIKISAVDKLLSLITNLQQDVEHNEANEQVTLAELKAMTECSFVSNSTLAKIIDKIFPDSLASLKQTAEQKRLQPSTLFMIKLTKKPDGNLDLTAVESLLKPEVSVGMV